MTGVQIIGKQAVVSRFEKLDGDSWAIYQGKQFIVGGQGSDDLFNWLDCFDKAGSTATYMLRVYDTDEPPTSATGNTDYIACISFKVVDQYDGQGIAGHNTKLMDRIGAIEKYIKEQGEEKEEEEDPDLNSVIMGWLTDPAKLNQVAGAVRTMLGGVGTSQPDYQPAVPSAAPIQTISGVKSPVVDGSNDPVARLAAALDKLEKKDPKIVEHLEKLAKLAESNPGLFNTVTSQLDLL